MSLGICLVASGITVGQTPDEDAETNVADTGDKGEASLTAEKWQHLEDTEKKVSVEIPGQPWNTQTQEEMSGKQSGGGCRRSSGQDYIVTIRHGKLKALSYLAEMSQTFIFRRHKDLDEYLDHRRTKLEEKLGDGFNVRQPDPGLQ